MRTPVTGSFGFLGTNACSWFRSSRRYNLVGVDCRKPLHVYPAVGYATLDLQDLGVFRGEAPRGCADEVGG